MHYCQKKTTLACWCENTPKSRIDDGFGVCSRCCAISCSFEEGYDVGKGHKRSLDMIDYGHDCRLLQPFRFQQIVVLGR